MFSKDKFLKLNSSARSPHMIVPGLVDAGSTVLDVGCNTGYIGKRLIEERGCQVSGIDIDEAILAEARKNRYQQTFKIDLYSDKFDFPREQYDYILFIDILEHLPKPDSILQKFAANNLKLGGKIIICLPNIARGEFRLSHLFGRFDYQSSGIMHEDHLRFFTKKTAIKMIEGCGLKIVETVPTGLGSMLKCCLNLTAFQFIFICQK